MIMNKSHAIVWIRQDFRISKNHALSYATNNHDLVSAIYIYNSDDFKDKRVYTDEFKEINNSYNCIKYFKT